MKIGIINTVIVQSVFTSQNSTKHHFMERKKNKSTKQQQPLCGNKNIHTLAMKVCTLLVLLCTTTEWMHTHPVVTSTDSSGERLNEKENTVRN